MIQIGIFASFMIFSVKRLLTYLHLFQQEEYDNARFLRLIFRRCAFDKTLSAILLSLTFANFIFGRYQWLFLVLMAVFFLLFSYREFDPRRLAKKKLVLTSRAKRNLILALVLSGVIGLCPMLTSTLWVWVIPIQLLPVLLVLANILLQPIENRIQRKYWGEAFAKVRELKPFTIGITGSFGKTSVKHILGHILGTTAPTLITPGSVNTSMGVTRIIRERLNQHHKYFVVEMGAYGPGSVANLCTLTPPDMAIITAIGHAHYERFRSLDAVAIAKFELAEATCGRGGKVITHADILTFPYAREFADTQKENFIICGNCGTALNVRRILQRPEGLVVEIEWCGKHYTAEVPLFGMNHGMNVALAFAAACTLGIAPEMVLTALKSTPQIAHRLEVRTQPQGGITLIDDAYNSNPQGFVAALQLLDELRQSTGRRILVTPGIVELGEVHDVEHAKLGRLALRYVDIVIAVGPERIMSFVEAFRAGADHNQELIPYSSFADAQSWLDQHASTGDVILLENDLPDIYESKLRL